MATSADSEEAPAASTTLVRMAMAKLGTAILNASYPEGATLPPEAELAAELGVGRGTLREVVKALVSKGLLTVGPRRGTQVRSSEHWRMLDPDVIQWFGENPGFVDALSEFRLAVEPAAAAIAAEKITRLQAAQLLAVLEDMQCAEHASAEQAVEADLRFHLLVLEATQNPLFLDLRHALLALLRTSFRTALDHHRELQHDSFGLHEALAEAICAHDPLRAAEAARALIVRHRADVHRYLLKS